jgi:hypothetical protein
MSVRGSSRFLSEPWRPLGLRLQLNKTGDGEVLHPEGLSAPSPCEAPRPSHTSGTEPPPPRQAALSVGTAAALDPVAVIPIQLSMNRPPRRLQPSGPTGSRTDRPPPTYTDVRARPSPSDTEEEGPTSQAIREGLTRRNGDGLGVTETM